MDHSFPAAEVLLPDGRLHRVRRLVLVAGMTETVYRLDVFNPEGGTWHEVCPFRTEEDARLVVTTAQARPDNANSVFRIVEVIMRLIWSNDDKS